MILAHGSTEESFTAITRSGTVVLSSSSISADGAPSCHHCIASTNIATTTAAAIVIIVVVAGRIRTDADWRHRRNQSWSN